MVIAVNYLGNPDNGVILAGYLGSALMAGVFIAIGACISATTSNQVIAFVGSFLVSMLFNVSGFPMVIDYLNKILPGNMIEIIQGFSFVTNFDVIIKGLLDIKVLVYFASVMLAWMVANVIILEKNKARN
jgi:ABC-2 type transport system permease protein